MQQAGKGLVLGMLVAARPEHVGARLAPEHVHRRVGHLVGEGDQRHDDRDEDALQGAEQHDARQRDQRPDELRAPHDEDRAELRRLDQAERVDDDDGAERRMRHERRWSGASNSIVSSVAAAVTSAASWRARAREAIHRGLRRPAAGRHRAQQARRPTFARPVASSSRFACSRGSPVSRERAPRRDRLGEAHQRDAQRRRPQLRDQREVRQRQRRQPGRNLADRADAVAPAGRTGSPRRCRRRPRSAARAHAGRSARTPPGRPSSTPATATRRQRRLRKRLDDGDDVVEERRPCRNGCPAASAAGPAR